MRIGSGKGPTVEFNQFGLDLLTKFQARHYLIAPKDGSGYYITPKELVDNYAKYWNLAKNEKTQIMRFGVKEGKLLRIHLASRKKNARIEEILGKIATKEDMPSATRMSSGVCKD